MGTEQRLEVRSQGAKAWGLVVLAELDMRSQCELRAGALVGARNHHRRPPSHAITADLPRFTFTLARQQCPQVSLRSRT